MFGLIIMIAQGIIGEYPGIQNHCFVQLNPPVLVDAIDGWKNLLRLE
jgi:hypothetical protein